MVHRIAVVVNYDVEKRDRYLLIFPTLDDSRMTSWPDWVSVSG